MNPSLIRRQTLDASPVMRRLKSTMDIFTKIAPGRYVFWFIFAICTTISGPIKVVCECSALRAIIPGRIPSHTCTTDDK